MNRDLRQRDIWWVDLEPTRGTETQKHRPCVILQNILIAPEDFRLATPRLRPQSLT
jgi:mRNA interferase MazF